MEADFDSFDSAIGALDAAVADSGLDIWIGAEPTFTNRLSEDAEWLTDALGKTKQDYARRIIRRLYQAYPGSMILRTLGRQYPGEDLPRWSYGLYQRRDALPLAPALPLDPLTQPVVARTSCDTTRLATFWQALATALNGNGWRATAFSIDDEFGQRILFCCDDRELPDEPDDDKRLQRTTLHTQAIPAEGLVDELAAEGLYLLALGCLPDKAGKNQHAAIELPALPEVSLFSEFLSRLAHVAQQCGLDSLIWCGFPPPVDASIAWTTITPDPAVIEINEAPARNLGEFLDMSRQLFAVIKEEGLAPYRLHYNGEINESGGGGQFTLGGASPEASPFFVAPQLLSRLVGYLNQHPSLSYWFAPRYVGSFSQSPRTDENVRESFSELQVALQQLASSDEPDAEFIWRSLSPFLVDTSGNSHRSEINIEKLWNPYLPGRGQLGLVEFRAFRMAQDAETATAIAALLRALIAMLAKQSGEPQLTDWGSQLHDRFALPYYLRQDLQQVCDDLDSVGFGLGAAIRQRLFIDGWRHLGHAELQGCRLDVDQAIEFWPLLGDASQHEGGSRLVDASTSRLQLLLQAPDAAQADLDGWSVLARSYRLPLRMEQTSAGPALILGLRYRAFVPWTGLHPGIGKQMPLVLTLLPPAGDTALRITLHDWQPDSLPYDGLPDSIEEAQRRIRERFVIETISRHEIPQILEPPTTAVTDYCLDLRRV
ncbi:MAG: transglutaminase family protein [Chromatiales bacterium]